MNKRTVGNICIAFGILLILGAGALYAFNLLEERRADEAASHITLELAEDLKDPASETGPNGGMMEEHDVHDGSNETPDFTMDEVEIDGHKYIGLLTIPVLELQLPVMSDWSYPSLKIAPCRFCGTVRGNDLVILAHNYKRHFGMIKTLAAGDEVIFTDVHNVTTVYDVVEIEEIQPTDIEGMTLNDFELTLFTCTYGGRARYTVRCSRKAL